MIRNASTAALHAEWSLWLPVESELHRISHVWRIAFQQQTVTEIFLMLLNWSRTAWSVEPERSCSAESTPSSRYECVLHAAPSVLQTDNWSIHGTRCNDAQRVRVWIANLFVSSS